MAEPKTKATEVSVEAFIDGIADETRRKDARTLLDVYGRVTGEVPIMWGPSIIGYGRYRYQYASGREGEWMRAAFSPRKANMVVYLIAAYGEPGDKAEEGRLLGELGPYKMGKSCLYLTRLEKVNMAVLERLIAHNWAEMARRYPE